MPTHSSNTITTTGVKGAKLTIDLPQSKNEKAKILERLNSEIYRLSPGAKINEVITPEPIRLTFIF